MLYWYHQNRHLNYLPYHAVLSFHHATAFNKVIDTLALCKSLFNRWSFCLHVKTFCRFMNIIFYDNLQLYTTWHIIIASIEISAFQCPISYHGYEHFISIMQCAGFNIILKDHVNWPWFCPALLLVISRALKALHMSFHGVHYSSLDDHTPDNHSTFGCKTMSY